MATPARPHRLLWSPHPNHNQFLIGSSELRLFEWTPEDAEGKPHATPIAANTDVNLMKCFTWSPDPNYMDLIAVGLTTGRTMLVRMHKSEPWFFDEKGSDFRPDAPRQVSIAQNQRTYPQFSARHTRACNAVAFSKGSPNLLAVGLDKVRNDYCLMVWDIEQAMARGVESNHTPSGSIAASNRSVTGSIQTSSRLGRTTEFAESYFDNRLSMNPLSLAENTSTTRALSASSFDHPADKPLCQYGSSEVITSCAWFTHDPKVLAAGMGMKYIRVYDTREDQNSPSSMVISTKAVHGLCMDPFHDDRMASCTDDGNISIWDIRKASQPILSFDTGPQKAPLIRIQFNPKRSAKPSSKPLQSFAWIPTIVSNSTSGLISINKEPLIETTILKETSQVAWEPKGALVVADGNAISCFPSQRSLEATVAEPAPQVPLSEMRKRGSKVLNLQLPANRRANGETVGTIAPNVSHPPSISIMLPGGLPGQSGAEASRANGYSGTATNLSRRTSASLMNSGWNPATNAEVDAGLEDDISVTMRDWALKGYSMDANANINLVDAGALRDLWAWMVRAEKIAQRDEARIGKFDFSYQGVLPVVLGSGVSRRPTPSGTPRAMSPLPRASSDLSSQLSKQADDIPIVPSLKLAQRKLALRLCGSELYRTDLKKTVDRLESEGSFEVAAGWAFFHGELDLAIEVLSRGDDKLKLTSIILAGFSRNQGGLTGPAYSNNEKPSNSAWKTQCKIHGQSQTDPYIRAIFSYIASGDWRDVLDEKSLSLADRVGVALRFLGDDELMSYIQSTAESLTNAGEIDGIILTGLTETGLDLLTNYVNRTGDIQTVALISSVAVPRYFKDARVEEWVDCYRELLDRWQLYYTRARFDIARGRCLQQNTASGVSAADITPTQIYVRCNFCNQSIARNLLVPGVRGRDGRRLIVPGGSGPGTGAGHGLGMHSHDKQGSMAGGMGQGTGMAGPGGATGGAPGTSSGSAGNSNKAVNRQASIYGSLGVKHVATVAMPCTWQNGSTATPNAPSATATASVPRTMPSSKFLVTEIVY
ncbi:hypothetical protein BGX31_007311 [Mortierella sp. GBA43]|nr:hypothetical protein BGX31_007311 [Mortierella sp. GBA43]